MNQFRKHSSPRISAVGPLERSDLAFLQQKSIGSTIQKLRDSHHIVARLLATGLPQTEIAARTGYSQSRISLLGADPSVRELVEHYRSLATAAWLEAQDEYYTYIYSNGLKAQRMISDTLDEADATNTPIPVNRLLAIAADSADRVGYTKKSTTFNVNVDFAAKLEAARKRSSQVIDAKPAAVSA